MAANKQPIFTLTPICAVGDISTANTNRDGTGTIVDIVTGSTYGTRIERVVGKAVVTTTAGMWRLFLKISGTYYLFEEISVSAQVPSGTVQGFTANSTLITSSTPLILPSGVILSASTNNAEAAKIFALGGSYS